MQAGSLAGSDVSAFTSRVLVDGIMRAHVSWSIDRELSGDLPAQVVAGSGITQATGSVSFAGEDVQTMGRNPWNRSTGWLPRPADRVQIFAGDGVTEWVQFTGRIDEVAGSLGGGFKATLIDDYDKLSSKFSHVPLLRVMPPLAEGGEYRAAGLTSGYYVAAALRRAGFYTTPRAEAHSALSVPAQGSLWPEYGTMQTGLNGGADGGAWASVYRAPWGVAMGDFVNTYTPIRTESPWTPVQVTLCVAPDHNGTASFVVNYGTKFIRIYVYANRNVQAYIGSTSVATLAMGAGTIVTALFADGKVTLRNNAGGSVTATGAMDGQTMSSIVLNADAGSRVAGFQVSHPATSSQEFISLGHTPSAVIDATTTHAGVMDAAPAIENRTVTDLLKEISGAVLAGMWLDEAGVFRWVPSVALMGQQPVRTVTTLDDVFSLDWQDSLLGVRSAVTVKYQKPAVSKGRWQNTVLYEGPGSSLESEDLAEEFVGPAGSEDWIGPDEWLKQVGTGNWSLYNRRRGSYSGAYYSTSDGATTSSSGLTVTVSMEKLGVAQYKITHKAGVYPTGVLANLGTSPTDTNLWVQNRDRPLPVIRGFGKVTWADATHNPITAGGNGPDLEHDAGCWNSRTDSVEIIDRIGNYLASQTSVPKPTITGLRIAYDPRLQLGDVITLSSPNLMGVEMRCLIVRIGNSAGPTYSQSLDVRVISANSTFTTYEQFNAAGGQLTHGQWQLLEPLTLTHTQFNSQSAEVS